MAGRSASRRSNRTTIRGVLLVVIIATIPLYVCGIGLWFLSRDGGSDARPTATATFDSDATRTPIDTNAVLTQFALTASSTPQMAPSATIPVFQTFEPIVLTFTSAPVFTSPTMIPTRFVTSTATLPPSATSVPPTALATNTLPPSLPTATEPILIPPTDTPAP